MIALLWQLAAEAATSEDGGTSLVLVIGQAGTVIAAFAALVTAIMTARSTRRSQALDADRFELDQLKTFQQALTDVSSQLSASFDDVRAAREQSEATHRELMAARTHIHALERDLAACNSAQEIRDRRIAELERQLGDTRGQ